MFRITGFHLDTQPTGRDVGRIIIPLMIHADDIRPHRRGNLADHKQLPRFIVQFHAKGVYPPAFGKPTVNHAAQYRHVDISAAHYTNGLAPFYGHLVEHGGSHADGSAKSR